MTWTEAVDDPVLRDLPFKIELNRWGNLEMSPARKRHGDYQLRIGFLLQTMKPDGVSSAENGVNTTEGTRVPDVVWASFERRRLDTGEVSWSSAPEICVEISSPDNSREEQRHKGYLYLEAGAEEFWTCDELGYMRFFDAAGSLERSRICPEFPLRVVFPG